MDKKLNRQIVRALKMRRSELQDQIGEITRTIETLQPKKELPHRTGQQIRDESVLIAVSDDWKTVKQIQFITGITAYSVHAAILRLGEAGLVDRRDHGGVPHYRRKLQHLRLVAGEGELKSTRSS